MKVEQNIVSRDWTVLHKGRRFYVNFTESDVQTLALCNRDNWEVSEETEDGIEGFSTCLFDDSIPEERKRAEEAARMIDELIAFCIDNWDNEFIQGVQDDLQAQRAFLEA